MYKSLSNDPADTHLLPPLMVRSVPEHVLQYCDSCQLCYIPTERQTPRKTCQRCTTANEAGRMRGCCSCAVS